MRTKSLNTIPTKTVKFVRMSSLIELTKKYYVQSHGLAKSTAELAATIALSHPYVKPANMTDATVIGTDVSLGALFVFIYGGFFVSVRPEEDALGSHHSRLHITCAAAMRATGTRVGEHDT
jgi:hypothetical protein